MITFVEVGCFAWCVLFPLISIARAVFTISWKTLSIVSDILSAKLGISYQKFALIYILFGIFPHACHQNVNWSNNAPLEYCKIGIIFESIFRYYLISR